MTYRIREVLAYSALGKILATWVRDRWYPKCRVHWVQQAFADGSTAKLVK